MINPSYVCSEWSVSDRAWTPTTGSTRSQGCHVKHGRWEIAKQRAMGMLNGTIFLNIYGSWMLRVFCNQQTNI